MNLKYKTCSETGQVTVTVLITVVTTASKFWEALSAVLTEELCRHKEKF